MRFAAGTQVWVLCEDGEWWPAKIHVMDDGIRAFLRDGEDCCVEFYHNVGELYPVQSTDLETVCPFHADPSLRSGEERGWFANPDASVAIGRAMRECSHAAESPLSGLSPSDTTVAPVTHSFCANDLRNINMLLSAMGGDTATQMREALAQEGLLVTQQRIRKKRAAKQEPRKRARQAAAAAAPSLLARPHTPPQPIQSSPHHPSPPPVAGSDLGPSDLSEAPDFVTPAEPAVLDMLRSEVFEDSRRFVLSPKYRFIDVLGAVSVENRSIFCNFPSPEAVREVPAGGFASNRRVLLLPLTEDYDFTSGWMQPVEVDGKVLSMELSVDTMRVPIPPNWHLPSGRESTAVKAAPVADITSIVMDSSADIFTVGVTFSHIPSDTVLWSGIVVCVFAEEVPLDDLAEQITNNYQGQRMNPSFQPVPPVRARGDIVDFTEGYVRVQCPLTSLPMLTPVCSRYCEHLQCMELLTVLIKNIQSNIWNCPLCGVVMKPTDIIVNYRLREWLTNRAHDIRKVEYVIETPVGQPLRVQFKEARPQPVDTVDVDAE